MLHFEVLSIECYALDSIEHKIEAFLHHGHTFLYKLQQFSIKSSKY